jgi:hypothetical protein
MSTVHESASVAERSSASHLLAFRALECALAHRSPLARMFGIDPLAPGARFAYAGAAAELELADRLRGLGDDWTVFSSLPGSAILIGPPGVFSLSLRNHSGDRVVVGERTVVVEDGRFSHIDDVEHDAGAVACRMSTLTGESVTVIPCLLIAESAMLEIRRVPRPVKVLDASAVGSWLTGLPRVLSPAAVARYRSVVEGFGTDAELPTDRARFEAIRHRVITARRLRLAWAMLGAVLSVGAVVLLVSQLLGAQL